MKTLIIFNTVIVIALITGGLIWYDRKNNNELALMTEKTTEEVQETPLILNGENSQQQQSGQDQQGGSNEQTQGEVDPQTLPETIMATISTSAGDIQLELYPKVAPKTVINFANLAGQKFYDGTKFHRVISDFMIQGGDPNSKDDDPSNDGQGGPGYAFEDEINPKSLGLNDEQIASLESQGYKYNYELESMPVAVGTIAMANSGPNTNGSQFFIVTEKDQPHLYGKHTVFGKVIKGMDVVRATKQGDTIKSIKVFSAQ